VKTDRKSVSSAHKLDGLGKLKEHAPRSEHVHLYQDIGHIRKNLTDQTCKHLNSAYLTYLSCHENNEKNYAGMKATPHIN